MTTYADIQQHTLACTASAVKSADPTLSACWVAAVMLTTSIQAPPGHGPPSNYQPPCSHSAPIARHVSASGPKLDVIGCWEREPMNHSNLFQININRYESTRKQCKYVSDRPASYLCTTIISIGLHGLHSSASTFLFMHILCVFIPAHWQP